MKEETSHDPVLVDNPEHQLYLNLCLDSVFKKVYTGLPIDLWGLRLQANINKNHKKADQEWS